MTPSLADSVEGTWLKAADGDSDEAACAFDILKTRYTGSLEEEPRGAALMPLVAWSVGSRRPGDRILEECAARSPFLKLAAQSRSSRAAVALGALHNAGIRTLMLKGMALAYLHYPAPWLRPMSDLDILVPTAQAFDAMSALIGQGFVPAGPSPLSPHDLRWGHSIPFASLGATIDLHWHALEDRCGPDDDQEFWRAAVSLDIGGVATRALSPTDQLAHVLVHAARWSSGAPTRYLVDASYVLRSVHGEEAWERLVRTARRLRVVVALREGLSRIALACPARVPKDLLARLRAEKTDWVEEWAGPARRRSPSSRTLRDILAIHLETHRWRVHSGAAKRGPVGWSDVLGRSWGLTNRWRLPAEIARRSWKHFGAPRL